MNITIKPWKPGDGGLICLPLRSNIPDASKHPDWHLVTCPRCGRECWEPELAHLQSLFQGVKGDAVSGTFFLEKPAFENFKSLVLVLVLTSLVLTLNYHTCGQGTCRWRQPFVRGQGL